MKEGKQTVDGILDGERRLYSQMGVSDKYGVLERMRLALDGLYAADREAYEEAKGLLRPNTWDALEENWKLWDPVPKSNVAWSGPGDRVCTLLPGHPAFEECRRLGFVRCVYDEHGAPDFGAVTFPGSVVDVSDLYDALPVDNIQKRGGSRMSLQELAQERMARNLEDVIRGWGEANGCGPDFYRWRDAHDLVPHEDTDCRTMRLVARTAHTAFKHRGGVANAVNVKIRFETML